MKYFLSLLILTLFLTACSQEAKQKLSYNEKVVQNPEILKAESLGKPFLPVQIDSTAYLFHPVGELKINNSESRWSNFGSSGPGSGGYSQQGYFSSDTYSGNLFNIKFQHITSDTLTVLTDLNIRINSFSFLRELYENTGKQFLLYQVYDYDSNKDSIIDQADIRSLYLSRINGKDFRKITSPNQEMIDWKLIPILNRLYFRSIEDTNKNGKFEKDDKLHYFYIDFNTENLDVEEYYPE